MEQPRRRHVLQSHEPESSLSLRTHFRARDVGEVNTTTECQESDRDCGRQEPAASPFMCDHVDFILF